MVWAQFNASTTAQLPAVLAASVAWGDYDNDNDLDIVLTGLDNTATAISRVYKNTGGGIFATAATLTGVSDGAVAWGDYDNDGDLDILLTGLSNSSLPISRVYRNNGGDSFTDIATLTGVYGSAAAWSDYDNDGDLDILIAGQTEAADGVSHIYRNNGGDSFTQTVSLAGVYNGVGAAWGDYDNDGWPDIALAGQTGLLSGVARIYRNAGDGSFTTAVNLPNLSLGLSQANLAWGDYDNDGDLDLLVSGSNLLGLVNVSTVYRNEGGNTFTAAVTLIGLISGAAAWGDYDNDGDLDIIQTGVSLGIGNSNVYRNDGASGFTVATTLTGVLMSSVAWGDYNNDGDLDLLLAGSTGLNPLTILYDNGSATANTPPSVPGGVQVVFSGSTSAVLTWSSATDAETPQSGLSYNISIGTTASGGEVRTPMADFQTGFRRIPAIGNTGQATSATLHHLMPGQAYYWSVQSIDAGLRGSVFTSGNFVVPTTTAIQLVVTDIIPSPPSSGEPFTIVVESQNSFGQVVAVTQATTISAELDNPYVEFSGSSQITLGAGESTTSLTLTIASTSSANVTAELTVSAPGLSATSQSVTIIPSPLYTASQLVVTDIIPSPPSSGEPFTIVVESQNSVGQVVAVTQATTIEVSFDHPYLQVGLGNTVTTLEAGGSSTTLTLTINNTSTASITTVFSIASDYLSATSQSLTISPPLSAVATALVVTIDPPAPTGGEPFTITIEAHNSFGQSVSVTQATLVDVSFSHPYLSPVAGSAQATLQTGRSSTTITMVLNGTSTATITVPLVVSSASLQSAIASIFVHPGSAYTASYLAISGVVPASPGSGETLAMTVESRNSFGQLVPPAQPTTVGVSVEHPCLVLSGSTQAILQPGESSIELVFAVFNHTTSSVTADFVVAATGFVSTTQSIAVGASARMNIRVVLEGPSLAGNGVMATALQAQSLVPVEQPYAYAPFNYNGSERAAVVAPSVVDWVLVELRTSPDAASAVMRSAVFLHSNGSLADTDGWMPEIPADIPSGNYYVVVYHRNHLPVMSAEAVSYVDSELSCDFSTGIERAFTQFYNPMTELPTGQWALFAGDTGQDAIINAVDRVDVRNHTGQTGYLASDISLDGIVNAADRILVSNNRFAVSQVP